MSETTIPKTEPLSLELCRQLKAAGFPQKECAFYWIFDSQCESGTQSGWGIAVRRMPVIQDVASRTYVESIGYDHWETTFTEIIACPNSDELMGAIGGGFSSIVRMPNDWVAAGCDISQLSAAGSDPGKIAATLRQGVGKTVKEALALLYLALHEPTGSAEEPGV